MSDPTASGADAALPPADDPAHHATVRPPEGRGAAVDGDPTMSGRPSAPPVDPVLADLRRSYARAALDMADVDPDPLVQFRRWFQEALDARVVEPNAMTLATAAPDGTPSARVVLLKGADARGFTLYTN